MVGWVGGWVGWWVGGWMAGLRPTSPTLQIPRVSPPGRGGGGWGGVLGGKTPRAGGVESPLNNVFFGQFGLKHPHVPLPQIGPGGPPLVLGVPPPKPP